MCTFLTVGVDRRRAASFEAALKAARLHVSREVNPKVAALFPANNALFVVTHGGCSCGLWFRPVQGNVRDLFTRRMKRFVRRGYSTARIARSLAEPPKTPRPEPERDGLEAAVRAHAPVRLCLHCVRGDPRTEDVVAGAVELVDV